MLTIKPRPYMSSARVRDFGTSGTEELPATHGLIREIKRLQEVKARAGWKPIIDQVLMSWLRDPAQFEDEGIEPPSGMVVRLAMDLAERFRDEGLAPPDFVTPDPNGSIAFERRQGNISELFQIWEDGCVEYMRFEGTNLVERTVI